MKDINPINQVNLYSKETIKLNDKTEKKDSIKIKEDKKKIALALTGLAVIAAAGVGVAVAVKKGKLSSVKEAVKKSSDKVVNAAKDKVDDVAQKASNAAKDKADDVVQIAADAAKDKADDVTKKAVDAAKDKADDVAKKAVDATKDKADDVAKKAAKATKGKADSAAKKAVNATKDKADDAVAQVKNNMATKVNVGGNQCIEDVQRRMKIDSTTPTKLSDVKISKGIVRDIDGKNFNGIIETANKNGQVLMQVENGKIVASIFNDKNGGKVAKEFGETIFSPKIREIRTSFSDDSVQMVKRAAYTYSDGSKMSGYFDEYGHNLILRFFDKDGSLTDKITRLSTSKQGKPIYQYIINDKKTYEMPFNILNESTPQWLNQISSNINLIENNYERGYKSIKDVLKQIK